MKHYAWDYLILQGKRARRLLPQMLALTLLLAACAALAGFLLSARSAGEEAKQRVRIGLVGDLDEGMIRMGLTALETFDSSRFSLSFEPMEEETAQRELNAGTLAGYVRVPSGFIQGMETGEHKLLTFVTAGSAAGFGPQIARELVTAVAGLLRESENAIYGAQDYLAAQVPEINAYSAGDRLARDFLLAVLDRESLYEVELLGADRQLSFPGYYLCGLSLAFLLLGGLSGSPFFARRSRELDGILHAAGLRSGAQVLGEYLPFTGLSLCAALTAAVLGGLLAHTLHLTVPELAALSLDQLLLLLLRALPVLLMIAAMQFALYELSAGAVGGVLLQFLNAAVQGYLAGCFYPASFFPAGMRRLGAILPAGAGMRRLTALLSGTEDRAALALTLGWLVFCLAAAIFCRARRIRKGGSEA